MATVIDSLVVMLGLDGRGFKKGADQNAADQKRIREDTAKTSAAIEARAKQMAAAFAGVRNELIGVLAIFTAGKGIKDFIADTTAADASTGRLAHNLNLSANTLSAWEGAAVRAGGTAAGIAGAFQGLSDNIQQWAATGQSSLVPLIRAMNATPGSAQVGFNLPLDENMLRIAQNLHAIGQHDAQRASWFGRQLGLDPDTVNVLVMQGRAGMERLIAETRRYSPTKADTDAAQRFQGALRTLTLESAQFGRQVLTALTPSLVKLMGELGTWIEKNRTLITSGIVTWIKDFVTGANSAAAAVGGWKNAIELVLGLWLGSKFASALAAARLLAGVGLSAAGVTAAAIGATASLSGDTPQDAGKGGGVMSDPGGNPGAIARFFGALPRSIRNNSPTNLLYRGQSGATLEENAHPRFAHFGTMVQGVAAFVNQIMLDRSRGLDTISGLISKYSPASDGNDTKGYIKKVASDVGIDANAPLDPNNREQLMALIRSISRIEAGGSYLKQTDLEMGINAARMGIYSSKGEAVSSRSTSVTIGKIDVNAPHATDANGIAAALPKAIQRNGLIAQATGGLY